MSPPLYEYRCPECDQELEVFHSMSASPAIDCPECKSRMTRQVGSNIGAHFRGAGFYATDYNQPTANNKRVKK